MFSRLISSLTVTSILVLLMCCDCTSKRTWQFEPVSLDVTTSNAEKFSSSVRLERVGREEYAFSGALQINYDVDETTMIEAVSYRSNTAAEDDYVKLPWTISKQTMEKFTNDVYREISYKNLKDCSNLPDPDKAYPWPRGSYQFNKCAFSGEGLPDYLPEAYYKFIFKVTGEVEWNFMIILKVVQKVEIFG